MFPISDLDFGCWKQRFLIRIWLKNIQFYHSPIRLFVFVSCSGVVFRISIHHQTCPHTQIWILVVWMHDFCSEFTSAKQDIHKSNSEQKTCIPATKIQIWVWEHVWSWILIVETTPEQETNTNRARMGVAKRDIHKSNSEQKSSIPAPKTKIWVWEHVWSWIVIPETTSEQETNINRARVEEWENRIFASQILSKTLI